MMYGGFGWGWTSLIVVLLLVLAALIVLIVRLFTMGTPRGTGTDAGPVPRSSARQTAEERLARGEISPEEFGQIVRALDRPS